jgi:hypothetical protein
MDFNKKWEGGGEGEGIDRIEEGNKPKTGNQTCYTLKGQRCERTDMTGSDRKGGISNTGEFRCYLRTGKGGWKEQKKEDRRLDMICTDTMQSMTGRQA